MVQLIENQYRNLANQVFEKDGETYVGAKPVEELHALRKDTRVYPDMTALNEEVHKNVFDKNDGAFEIQTDITMDNSRIAGIDIMKDLSRHEFKPFGDGPYGEWSYRFRRAGCPSRDRG